MLFKKENSMKNMPSQIKITKSNISRKDSPIWTEFGETKSKIREFFLEAKIEKIKNEKLLENAIKKCQKIKLNCYEFKRKKISKWNKVRGVLKFMGIMKGVIRQKKLMGLSSSVKFLDQTVNEKKKKLMLTWISGNLDESEYKKVKKKKWYLLYEDSYFLIFWNYVIIILFIYTVLFLPYKIAFVDVEDLTLIVIEWVVNILFLFDIFFSMITVFVLNGELVEDFKTIFTNYAKSWLILDIFSIFPFDLLLSNKNDSFSDFAKLSRTIKLVKIFRIIKFSDKLSKNQNNTKKFSKFLSANKQVKDFFGFFLLIIALTHITGCLWYFLTKIQSGSNWTDLPAINFKGYSEFDKYLTSFYWAISTICTVGFGDIAATTAIEKIFNIVWICVGVAFYSYTIGTLSSILNYTNKKKSIISSQFSFINEFSKEKNIDKKLLEKITINLEYIEQHKKYSDNLSLNFLQDISLDLTYKIARHIHSDLIQKVVLFNKMDINFVAQIIPYIVLHKYKAGEVIYKKNEYPSNIFFLLKGRVGFYNDSNKLFKTYIEGSYFGELEVFKSCLRQYKTKVLEDAHMLLLSRNEFLNELQHFPEIYEEIHLRAIERDIINKKTLNYLQKMSFINLNSIIDDKVKQEFMQQQKNCRNTILKLKKEIMIIVDEINSFQDKNKLGDKESDCSSENDSVSDFKFHKQQSQINNNEDLQQKINEFNNRLNRLNWEIVITNDSLSNIYNELKNENYTLKKRKAMLDRTTQCDLYYNQENQENRYSMMKFGSDYSKKSDIHSLNYFENNKFNFFTKNPLKNNSKLGSFFDLKVIKKNKINKKENKKLPKINKKKKKKSYLKDKFKKFFSKKNRSKVKPKKKDNLLYKPVNIKKVYESEEEQEEKIRSAKLKEEDVKKSKSKSNSNSNLKKKKKTIKYLLI